MPQQSYIISGGQQGADRLKILANTMWPYTEPFLKRAGLTSAMKCLDVGCGNGEITKRMATIVGKAGHITGIDFDASVIHIAQNADDVPVNAKYEVVDIEKKDIKESAFDFIFCRFIISHLQTPEVVLQKLRDALRPGGILAIEDVDFQGHFCYPPNHAFITYVHWYEQVAIRKGGNPMIGPLLTTMVSDLGLENVEMNVVLPTFYKGDGKLMGILTLQAIRDTIIAEGIARAEEVDETISELQSFTQDKRSIMSLPRIFQVSANRI